MKIKIALFITLAVLTLTACSPAMNVTMNKTVYIAPETVDCVGVAPMQCMQVREDPNDPWGPFFGAIEGFTYQPGYSYQLRIEESTNPNPPADGSSVQWKLVEEVSKESAGPIRTVYIGPKRDACESGSADLCYQVRETPDAEWQLFSGEIEKFAYEPGYIYQISVMLLPVENAADGSTGTRVVLLEILSQTSATSQLAGTEWVLVSINGQPVMENTETTAAFSADGIISGSAGCNNYTGGYKADGSNIFISSPGVTRKLCPEPSGLMPQENLYLAVLTASTTFKVDGGSLQLAGPDGTQSLIFQLR